ncbi:nuclear transport factor 2 family protein [Prauserella flavalba]|uniref:nuclear transport factor 2 family protein n=1 Tax=Prauserella flavalba TaxID=1477506 RepID=UPI000D7710B6|nr:nuclear transport factor 2 family protein [Prauserella flavalba]
MEGIGLKNCNGGWTREQLNIGLALRAWSFFYINSAFRAPGNGDEVLFELLAEDVIWSHEGPKCPDLPTYPGEVRGKQALVEMLSWEQGVIVDVDLEDPVVKPLEFLATGDRVVMINEERYFIKKTAKTVRNNWNAVIMDFTDGLITRIRIISNLNDYIESELGVGWSSRVPELS